MSEVSSALLAALPRVMAVLVALAWFGLMANAARAAAGDDEDTPQVVETTSTSQHSTVTRVDLPELHAYRTRVLAVLDEVTVFDETAAAAPDTAAVQALEDQATVVLQAAGAGPITGPALVDSHQSSNTASLGVQITGTKDTITQTVEVVNPLLTIVNTNTHTETFIDQLFQTTVTDVAAYQLTGSALRQVEPPTPTVPPAEQPNANSPPVEQPNASSPPVEQPSPTVAASMQSRALARTGSNTLQLFAIAVDLLVAGATLLVAGDRFSSRS